MKIKKLIICILATALSATLLTACGGGTDSSSGTNSSSASSSSSESSVSESSAEDSDSSESSEESKESSDESDSEESESSESESKTESSETEKSSDNASNPAIELVKDMKVGWNLGNSLDSVGADETAWGNPKVTENLIKSVKDAGFNTVRIPVTYLNHTGDAPDYKIEEAWLDRVGEVVNYVLDNDMYAIINIHHDGMDSGDAWLTPAPEDENVMMDKYEKMWTQIADYFKDYSDKLVFEGMNELHKGYDTPEESYYKITNKLNQKFVDIVRASGGNNAERFLSVPGYNTNVEYTVNKLTLPKDTVENHIIVTAHFYDPYTFALEAKTKQWGKFATETVDDWGQEDWTEKAFDMLKEKFVDNGIPVLISEFGCTGGIAEDYRAYYDEYVVKTAHQRGLTCILWDNGSDGDGAEAFGHFDRNTGTVLHQKVIDGIMRGAETAEDYEVMFPQ